MEKSWSCTLACWYVTVRVECWNQYSIAVATVIELHQRKGILKSKDPFEHFKALVNAQEKAH